jgi:hypothetical protein
MNKVQKLIFIAPLAILGILVLAAVGGKIVADLWNWLLPPLLGWRVITFWQALGVLVLCRILFGGRGWCGFGRSNFRRHMQERCGNMTPEQRETFRRERFGFGPSTAEGKG